MAHAGRMSGATAAAAAVGKEKRKRRPKFFWDSPDNRRAFMKEVAEALGVEKKEDWRRVQHRDVVALGGGGLLAQHNNSLQAALEELYGAEEGRGAEAVGGGEDSGSGRSAGSSYRPRVRSGHWGQPEVQRAFMDKVADAHNVQRLEDWASVTFTDIAKLGGTTLLKRYSNSVLKLLQGVYPEQRFSAVKHRPSVPRGYWDDVANQREFLDGVAEELSIRSPSDWSRVRNADIEERGGRTLLKTHGWSLLAALQAVYGSDVVAGEEGKHAWSPHACRGTVAKSYWQDDANVVRFMQDAAAALGIRCQEDWYRVSQSQIRTLNGSGLLARMRLVDALQLAFPDRRWSAEQCASTVKKSSQRKLLLAMEELFPSVSWLEDHKHPLLHSAQSSSLLELDVYAPDLHLACEYQGEHHYHELPFFGPLEVHQARDREKRRLCQLEGIRLLEVPYWWDGSVSSLAASLNARFPGVLTQEAAA